MNRSFFLIWIQGPLIEEWRTRLAQLGAALIEALPTGAYKARLEPQQVQPVSQLPFVSRLQVLTALEAAPDFMTRAASEPAPPLAGKQAVAFDILLHRAEGQAAVRQWLEARRVPIAGASGRKIRAYLLENAPELNAIPALPEVERMEEFVPPELHNDRGRVLLNIDQGTGVTVAQTGAGQLVAIADTGMRMTDAHCERGTVDALSRVMPRRTAQTAKPLSLAERKASVAKIAATAPAKVRKGIKLIDFREPTAEERAFAETLAPRAREALARAAKGAAA